MVSKKVIENFTKVSTIQGILLAEMCGVWSMMSKSVLLSLFQKLFTSGPTSFTCRNLCREHPNSRYQLLSLQ